MKIAYLVLILLAFVVIISGCVQPQQPKASPQASLEPSPQASPAIQQSPEIFQEPAETCTEFNQQFQTSYTKVYQEECTLNFNGITLSTSSYTYPNANSATFTNGCVDNVKTVYKCNAQTGGKCVTTCPQTCSNNQCTEIPGQAIKTDPKVACSQNFCLIAWKDATLKKTIGRVTDIYGKTLVDNIEIQSLPLTTSSDTKSYQKTDITLGTTATDISVSSVNTYKALDKQTNVKSSQWDPSTNTYVSMVGRLQQAGYTCTNDNIYGYGDSYTCTGLKDTTDSQTYSINFQGQKTAVSSGYSAKDSARSQDDITKKFVKVSTDGTTGFVQVQDTAGNNIGSQISLGAVTSPPSVSNIPFTSTYMIAYPASDGVKVKMIDTSDTAPTTVAPATFSKPEAGTETADYSVIDTDEKTPIADKESRSRDIPVVLEHKDQWSKRLKGTLQFTKGDVDLSRLIIEADEKTTATNIAGVKGLANKILLIPDNNNDAGVLVCPSLSTLAGMQLALGKLKASTQPCLNSLVFNGQLPETKKDTAGNDITVKVAPQSNPNFANWNFDELKTGNVIQASEVRPGGVSAAATTTTTTGSSSTTSTTLPSGLVGRWELDEVSGTTASDSSGNNNAGSLAGSPQRVSGHSGSALSFSSNVRNYVNIPSIPALSPANQISVEMWVKPANQFTEQKYPLWKANSYGISIGDISGGNLNKPGFYLLQGGSWKSVMSTDAFTDTNWHHIVGTYDGSKITIYVDGIAKATSLSTGTIDSSAYNLGIGNYVQLPGVPEPTSNYFGGLIDGVRIYSKGLSATEVQGLYSSQPTSAPTPVTTSSAPSGTVSGSATLVDVTTGISVNDRFKTGKGMQFDGLGTFVTFPDTEKSGVLDQTSAITISSWIFVDALNVGGTTGSQMILRKLPASGTGDPLALYDIQLHQDTKKIGCGLSSGYPGTYKEAFSDNPITTKAWTLVTCRWDGTDIRLYINGVAQGTSVAFAGPIGKSNKELVIGGLAQSKSNFAGIIDDVFIYGKALTAGDISKLYADYSGEITKLLNPPPEPLFYEISGLTGSGAILLGDLSASPTPTATPTPSPSPTKKQSALSVSTTAWSSSAKDVVLKASYTTTQPQATPTPTPSTVIFTNDIQHPTYIFKDSSGTLAPNVGGIQELRVKKGDTVRIRSTIVATESMHKHGIKIGAPYNIDQEITSSSSSSPTEISFVASTLGTFDITCATCDSGSLGQHTFMKAKLVVSDPVSGSPAASESLISGATCKVGYSDEAPIERQMAPDTSQYSYSRTFQSTPSGITATVTCSHPDYYGQTQIVNLATGAVTTPTPAPSTSPAPLSSPSSSPSGNVLQSPPKVRLTLPKDDSVVGNKPTFVCTADGLDIKEISLYTDISGSWKKEEKKLVTDSPATVQFKKENVAEGTYKWNCEAKTASGSVYFADDNRSFEVKLTTSPAPVVDCNSSNDCGLWGPSTCPQTGLQTRTCKNSVDCGYALSRSCIYPGGPVPSPSPSASVQSDASSGQKTDKGGDVIPIVLGVVIAIGAGGGILFVIKRRQGEGGEAFWKSGKESKE